MKFIDATSLALRKIKKSPAKTVLSVIAISLIFGLIVSIVTICRVLNDEITRVNDSTSYFAYDFYGVEDSSKIKELALRLYSEDDAPNKEYPVQTELAGVEIVGGLLNEDNKYVIEASKIYFENLREDKMSKILPQALAYNGEVYEYKYLKARAKNVITSEVNAIRDAGGSMIILPDHIVEKYVNNNIKNEHDCIQVLISQSTAKQLNAFEGDVFESSFYYDDSEETVEYQVVGLLPNGGSLGISKNNADFQPLDVVLSSIQFSEINFVVVNPEDDCVQQRYREDFSNSGALVEIVDKKQAIAFFEDKHCMDTSDTCSAYFKEVLGNNVTAYRSFEDFDIILNKALILLVIITLLSFSAIMGWMLTDDAKSLEMYQVLGMKKGDIFKVYGVYAGIYALIVCAISIVLGNTFGYLYLAEKYNLIASRIKEVMMKQVEGFGMHFDLRIVLIAVAILACGQICVIIRLCIYFAKMRHKGGSDKFDVRLRSR